MKQGQILTYTHTQRTTIHVSIVKTVAANFQWLKAKRLAKMYRQMQTRITVQSGEVEYGGETVIL